MNPRLDPIHNGWMRKAEDAGGGGGTPQGRPPRIGLALSGGGALGLAHVGVIEVLEEAGIPVCAVAGTSMGAYVGSLYAAGKLGRNLGEGFYRYHGRRPRSLQHHDPAQLAEEAERCAREGVASSPKAVDLALVLGAGYPAWHGGPLARQAEPITR